MTTQIRTPQARGWVGFAQADITPPVGMYHRMWGAATHEVSTGIHRPLFATALVLQTQDQRDSQIILSLDHCLFEDAEIANIRKQVRERTGVPENQIQVAMSHTHGAGWLSRSRSHLPGGDRIGPYLDKLAQTCGELAVQAKQNAKPATLRFGTARCSLAAHRDFWDTKSKQFVCGFHPDGPTDDTVMLVKVLAESGELLGTVVNYACHPTTLAWQNTLISPDYIGAMREVIERETGKPCVFLQGASGDLGPRESYVGDVRVADRNGRELGYAALSGLETLHAVATQFEYAGPVVSGAILGTWEHRPLPAEVVQAQATWTSRSITVELPYRHDLPTVAHTKAELAKWSDAEDTATDPIIKRDAHAIVEQMNRQLGRLAALPEGKCYPFKVELLRFGDSIWIFTPAELYHTFQTTLRARFPNRALVISTITNGWQPSYLPTASSYGYGIYQEIISAVEAGSLEVLIESVARAVRGMTEEPDCGM